jgi:cell division septum initiation protein DivIVA
MKRSLYTGKRLVPSDSLNVDLSGIPRTFRGYDPEATEAVFTRVAWEYSVLSGENRKLKQSIENGPPPVAGPRLADLDEVSRSLLSASHRASREMREAAREECEAMLKAARRRAVEIEHDAARAAVNVAPVLESARALRSQLSAALAELESTAGPAEPRAEETEQASEALSTLDLVG